MSNRYKKQRTLTGLATGRRVRWLTFRPTNKMVYEDGTKPNHIFMIVKLNSEGELEYVGWTGQIGICRIKGEIHHYVPGNMFAHTDQNHIVIYSVYVPFGTEDENCATFVRDMNAQMHKPILNWWAPAGLNRGTVKLEPATSAIEKFMDGSED